MVFDEPIPTEDGVYEARVCGGIAEDALWEGWVEFRRAGSAEAKWMRSGRETEQPNIADLRYWAGGLSVTFLQGAFSRAKANKGPPITHTDILAPTQEFDAEGNPSPASSERPRGRGKKR